MYRVANICNRIAALIGTVFVAAAIIIPDSVVVKDENPVVAIFGRTDTLVFLLLLASAIAVVNIGAVIRWIREVRARPYLKYVQYQKDDGVASVALTAIQSSLQRTARKLHDVADARVRVSKLKPVNGADQPLIVEIQYWSIVGTDLGETETRLREAMKFRLKEIVQIPEEQRRIDIHLRGIRTKETPRFQAQRTPPFDPDDVFTGPKYPIDAGDPQR
jgi:hypothetical protein